MAYRQIERKPAPPHRDVQGTASPSKVFVQNGTTLEYAIPCWYLVIPEPLRSHCHSRDHHDHVGWPSPTHPDHICQDWEFAHSCHAHETHGHHYHDHCDHYLDLNLLAPIHLKEEGYTSIIVAFDGKPNGLTVSGTIDTKRDWVVRITINSMVADAIKNKIEVPYAVFAVKGSHRDMVSHGVLVILPGPIGA